MMRDWIEFYVVRKVTRLKTIERIWRRRSCVPKSCAIALHRVDQSRQQFEALGVKLDKLEEDFLWPSLP